LFCHSTCLRLLTLPCNPLWSSTATPPHPALHAYQRGRVLLPDLAITDSSEALLTGRKPPYRLLVRALHKDGRRLSIKPAISEGFVVATRRTRSANKVRRGERGVGAVQGLCGGKVAKMGHRQGPSRQGPRPRRGHAQSTNGSTLCSAWPGHDVGHST
jgi:hypothetical protein